MGSNHKVDRAMGMNEFESDVHYPVITSSSCFVIGLNVKYRGSAIKLFFGVCGKVLGSEPLFCLGFKIKYFLNHVI